ncbi:EAL domain-containing protein [Nitrincola sp. MINF-07-Sa-05]|uniref:EAL domain-containing protein n=1 Tax=Nitrincola salilacus TaxID=3400273 RepID=UPI003917DE38
MNNAPMLQAFGRHEATLHQADTLGTRLPHSAFFRGRTLSSHFQPIFSLAHRRAVGYEGLIRAHVNGIHESPAQLLALPESSKEKLKLDRICRALHIQNFASQNTDDSWLFINLDSQCLVAEQPGIGFTGELLNMVGVEPHRLVIEIIESEISDHAKLQHFITHFRSLGCLIAIDDFGAGHSNIDRIWELEPDIVKIDRGLLARAGRSRQIARLLNGLVSLIHEAGSLVVLEGVETEEEALIAFSSNADMVQGFYFSKPQPTISDTSALADRFDQLRRRHQWETASRGADLQMYLQDIESLFRLAVSQLCAQGSFEQGSALLFQDMRTVRCYLLDKEGYQLARNIYAPHYQHLLNARFTPLLCGNNANWAHKDYHYRAIQKPGMIHISKPYLSVADSHMCITVSQAIQIGDQTQVLCCDVDWKD